MAPLNSVPIDIIIVFCGVNVDTEMCNIIDKLANFVARNGPEFEQMTQEKQRDNPKFFFLFGGEFNAYYRWKVASEQAGKPSLSLNLAGVH